MTFAVAVAKSKMTNTIEMTKFSRKMDKQLLKVSRLFKKMKKPYGEWHPSPPPLCLRLSVTSIHLVMLGYKIDRKRRMDLSD